MKKTDNFQKLVKNIFSGLRKPNKIPAGHVFFFFKDPKHIVVNSKTPKT